MRLFPFDRWTLDSALPPGELSRRLDALVEPAKGVRLGGSSRPFEGALQPGRFQISAASTSRNVFLPQLVGQIVATPTGSRVEVLVRLPLVTLGFLSSTLMFLGMIGTGVFLVRGLLDPGAWVPLLLIAAAYGLSLRSFSREADRARALLEPVVQS